MRRRRVAVLDFYGSASRSAASLVGRIVDEGSLLIMSLSHVLGGQILVAKAELID